LPGLHPVRGGLLGREGCGRGALCELYIPVRSCVRLGYTVFKNPPPEKITALLRSARTIAVVGLSADPSRPSNHVAKELQHFGYRIIPVTPSAAVILGEKTVPDLDHLGDVLKAGERVDVVEVFRKPEFVAAIVDDVIRLHLPALWLQDGVVDEEAAQRST